MTDWYRLTASELRYVDELAREVNRRGEERQALGIGKGETHGGHKRAATGHARKMGGFAAEIVVRRICGDPDWLPIAAPVHDFYSPPDAGGLCEVRHTAILSGHLLIHPKDHDDDEFVLIVGAPADRLEARGWLTASTAKTIGVWSPPWLPDPAWAVAQWQLSPWRDLKVRLVEKVTAELHAAKIDATR